MNFKDFFKQKRIATNVSLRQFCADHGYDPGNISKLERGLLPPSLNPKKLNELARAVGIKKGSDDYKTFCNLASLSNRTYQLQGIFENISDTKLFDKLPLLFQQLDRKSLTEEKLNHLIAAAAE